MKLNKLVAGLLGFLVGLGIGGRSSFPELMRRLRWSWSGGGGETADWGEPLFYLVIFGFPLGFVGAVIGVLLTVWFGFGKKRE